ncbi:integrase [Rhodovulum sp. PH10]|uniref:integrase n=1 Tax=Rhodovulum sp. PH10 TaxID=1187851 RepID=UPI003FD48FB1
MISEVYDAFVAAGAPEDKARRAAEAVANYEARFARIDADLLVLKWMTGTILGGVVALVVKAFFA